MATIDPALRFLASEEPASLGALSAESIFELVDAATPKPGVNALVQFTGDVSALESVGFKMEVVAGDVAAGTLDLARLDDFAEVPELERIEVARAMHKELDLTLPETRADAVHIGPPGHRGAGVIVGIIDSGIDYTHQAFRRSDGPSRILAIWDQGLDPQGSEQHPEGFTFGVEYRRADIDSALRARDPFAVARHRDAQIPGDGFHGTHVAGIAAGDGSVAGGGQPALTYVGLAPESEIVVVANNRARAGTERGMGDSADTFAAVRYIFDIAESLGRAAVINQSQGDNVGPHDGTSLLERGIDNLLGGPGRVMVKSAGNEGARGRHASGTVGADSTQPVPFAVPSGRPFPLVIDIWYPGSDRFDFAITTPGGDTSQTVRAGEQNQRLRLANANRVFVDSDLGDPANGDNRIFVLIEAGGAPTIEPGNWALQLAGTEVTSGQWDAWIQRGEPSAIFLPPLRNPARTISIPGTSAEIITAASYVTRGSGVGSISTFSSLGPTRDGRQAPTVAAPGQVIIAPQPQTTGDLYGGMQGTSMAAPAVTGAIALLLQKNPSLTQAEVKASLEENARADNFTEQTPNNAWGAGKLDCAAAFQATPEPEDAAVAAGGPSEAAAGAGANDTAYWHGTVGY
jgi:subtilisin family serine protease